MSDQQVQAQHQESINVGPFWVSSTMVNESDSRLIQYVFEHLRDNYMVFSSPYWSLSQSEFTTLKPGTVLDSLVIDIFAEILTNIERKKKTRLVNWYLPVTFSKAALSGDCDVSSFLYFVIQEKIRENYMSDLAYCDKIFIPVHIEKNSLGHFYLYIVQLKSQEVKIRDSLSDQFINNIERDETTQKLFLAMDKLFPDVMFSKFQYRMENNIFSQPNGCDCGIFVINFMQQSDNYVKRNPLFQFDSDEERLKLALKLLKSNLNEQREILYNKAGSRINSQGCSKGYMLPTRDLVGEEFQSYTQKIWKWIMEDEVSAIGIWGMAGVGKTALATHMHNKLLEEADADFDHVIWVTVSQHESILQLQKVIARSINLDISDEYEVKRIAGKLLQAFKHMNKCVLILDDVWDHIFLEEVGFPISNNRMKLILTTRLWEVCQGLDCKKNIIEVNLLKVEDTWALFENTLGFHEAFSLEVKETAMDIIKKCKRLPLAIVTIARSMKGKEGVREWSHMLECLKTMDNGQYDMDKWVFPVLRSSYTHLNNKLQRCFLYCAILETSSDGIPTDYLTKLFVYEELIDKKQSKAQHNECYTILDKLKNNSMLEKCKGKWYIKHTLLRIMAIGIAENTYKMMAKPCMNLTEIPHDEKWKEDLQEVFLSDNQIQEIPDGTSPRCSQLSTLVLRLNINLKWISYYFFNNMPSLKILDLSNTAIERLPKSVSNLKCLIALLLSGCGKLSHVPSLAELQRLISLDLSYTAITEAPSGLESLVNLRCLNLEDTQKLKMSTSSISKLTNLQSLKLDIDHPSSIDVRAQDLQGLEKLEAIEANFCDIQEFNTYVVSFLNRHSVLMSRYHLTVGTYVPFVLDRNDESFPKKRVSFGGIELGNRTVLLPDDINQLIISQYDQQTLGRCLCHVFSIGDPYNPQQIDLLDVSELDGFKYLCCFSPSCSFWSSLELARRLNLHHLKDLKSMVLPLHLSTIFDHLSDLYIYECNSMETLMRPELLAHLQNLESISIQFCDSMKKIVGEDHLEMIHPGSGNFPYPTVTLPKLRSVILCDLPELIFVYRGIMLCPSLQTFYASSCQKLNRPHIEISNGSMLPLERTSSGDRHWEILESGHYSCSE